MGLFKKPGCDGDMAAHAMFSEVFTVTRLLLRVEKKMISSTKLQRRTPTTNYTGASLMTDF
jgi:hypothetical protein